MMRLGNEGSFLQEICRNKLPPLYRVIIVTLLVTLVSCSGLPTATFSTTAGCGLAQWDEAWARENILSVTWDGVCKDGLTQGNGTLVASLKAGNAMRFVGQMSNGKLKEGNFLRSDGWTLSGEFVGGYFYKGTILRPGGGKFYEGAMILYQKTPSGGFIGSADQRFDQGKVYLTDGSYVEDGRYDGSLGLYVMSLDAIRAARGVIWGKYYEANGALQYRVVGGRRYADDANYTLAKNEYLKAEAAATAQANQAYMAELQRKEAEDRRLALGALAAGLGTQGSTANRLQAMQSSLSGTAPSATGSQAVGNSNNSTTVRNVSSDRVEIQATPHCGQYYKISDTPETRTQLRKISFGIRNTCSFSVRIDWTAFKNGQESSIETVGYSSHLPRGGPSKNIFFPPGAKVEIPRINLLKEEIFEVKIFSVCPEEDAAARIIGKPVKSVLRGKPGFCLVVLDVPEQPVGVSR